jgi:prepilin-type N-terminal cleavage/methylation domain-containing protein
MTAAPQTADRSPARRGFTLTEMMVVTTLIGVMAAISVPSFQRAVEQSRGDVAVANLRAIWAAERIFWLENRNYTSSLSALQSLGVLDGAIPADGVGSMGGYQYTISTSDSDTPFRATATSVNGLGYLSIDATGLVDSSHSTVTPGFQ